LAQIAAHLRYLAEPTKHGEFKCVTGRWRRFDLN